MLLYVHHSPHIRYVSENEGDEEGDVEHGAEGELAAAAVCDGQGTLQGDVGGIIGGVGETCHEEQRQYYKNHTDACGPDAFDVGRADDGAQDTIEEQRYADDGHEGKGPETEIVVEILHRLHEYGSGGRVDSITVLQQGAHKEGEEEHEEGHSTANESHRTARADVFVRHVVDDVKNAEHAGKEHHGKTEDEVPGIEQSIKSCGGIGPTADDGSAKIGERCLLHYEVGAIEERCYGASKEQGTHDAVKNKEPAVGAGAEQIALTMLKLIADGLQHEGEEDDHPEPVGAAEAGTIEKRERSKEGSTEGDEGGEGYLPLATGGLYNLTLTFLRPAKTEDEGIGALNEEHENEQRSDKRHYEPPVLLKKCVTHIS